MNKLFRQSFHFLVQNIDFFFPRHLIYEKRTNQDKHQHICREKGWHNSFWQWKMCLGFLSVQVPKLNYNSYIHLYSFTFFAMMYCIILWVQHMEESRNTWALVSTNTFGSWWMYSSIWNFDKQNKMLFPSHFLKKNKFCFSLQKKKIIINYFFPYSSPIK